MSFICGLPVLECVYCLGCARWVWKKCLYTAGYESENWGLATAEEFEPVPRICRIILSVYEEDLRNPQWAPPGGYGMNPDWVVLRKDYEDNQEYEVLRDLIEKNPTYMLIFGGHSLGAGVVALLTLLALHNRDKLGIQRNKIRCFALAPTRCMSLNLAVRYADVINSVVLQDDFLPRTTTALEDVFKSLLCLPCLLCIMCLKDTCTLEEKMLKDPRRLYAPGRLYHIVERKPLRIGRFPPVVRTAVPVDGRFEHIVLSCNATSDHAIIWIEREAQWALNLMLEKDRQMEIPAEQKMVRQESLAREHSQEYRAALQRAVALDIPQAYSPSSYGTFHEMHDGEDSGGSGRSKGSFLSNKKRTESWNEFVGRLFDVDDSGHMVFKKTNV